VLQVKKPIECSAPEYVEYLMEWIEGQLDDEAVRVNPILSIMIELRTSAANV
jgi:hypothetical protein